MKLRYTAILGMLALSGTCVQAQSVTSPHVAGNALPPTQLFEGHAIKLPAPATNSKHSNNKAQQALENYSISYFDATLPVTNLVTGGIYGQIPVLGFGQRFTLLEESAFVDSVQIRIDSMAGNVLNVILAPDTILQTQSGPFHFINIFNGAPDAFGINTLTSVAGAEKFTTVTFPHAQVPKNFWVVVSPTVSGNTITSAGWMAGDFQAPHPIDIDASRTAYLTISGGNYATAPTDNVFIPNGMESAIQTNFYMIAHISGEQGQNAVGREGMTHGLSIRAMQNPVVSNIAIGIDGMISNGATLHLFDGLGREVKSTAVRSANVELSTAGLAAGRYQAILTSGNDRASVAVQVLK